MKRLLLAPALLLTACIDPCGYRDLREYPSPDGRYIASVYEYDCGATTSFYLRVSIRPIGQSFNPQDNLVLQVKHWPKVQLDWRSKDTLRILCPECTPDNRVFTTKQWWRDIRIQTAGFVHPARE